MTDIDKKSVKGLRAETNDTRFHYQFGMGSSLMIKLYQVPKRHCGLCVAKGHGLSLPKGHSHELVVYFGNNLKEFNFSTYCLLVIVAISCL